MKKLFALLMTIVLAAAMTTSALAYSSVTPDNDKPAITHTLTLTNPEATGLDYNIEYTFDVADKADVVQPSDITNPSMAVTGAPKISTLTYSPADDFGTSKSCVKPLEIDWSEVKIMEPGVYRWEVIKKASDDDSSADPTNNRPTSYLYVYVKDNGGELTIESVNMTSVKELTGEAATKGNLEDSYPAKTLDLSISKTVTGSQGSKDQYFQFTVTLTSPASVAASKTYAITGHDLNVPATAYHESKTNVSSITVNSSSATSFDLWLKHGQKVTIKDLLFGTSYSITESANDGYTVSSTITGDATGTSAGAETASDTSLEVTSDVAFTNHKEAAVPTGIDLHTGAPFMGLMLAAALMVLLFICKRKEAAE